MAVNLVAPTSLESVKGVRLASLEANIRYKGRDDLTLIELAEGSSVAGVFTQNAFCAAPVTLCRESLSSTEGVRYLIINAGNANAGTGEEGMTSARMICAEVAEEGMSALDSVLPFSTGVIGEQLPYWKIVEGVPELFENLSSDNWMRAAAAIMTTDTVLKGVSKSLEVDGKTITITGMAKGSGMIEPNMATLLAYVATDAAIENSKLQSILNAAVKDSFNSITVDGDTSTNDSLILMATGKSGVSLDNNLDNNSEKEIIQAINDVCQELSQAIIRDAEGATKFVTINVEDAPDYDYAKEIAYSIARSPLVKTALFASDPNWGRFLMAIGKTPVKALDVSKLSLWLGETQLIQAGEPLESYKEEMGQAEMDKEEITIRVCLNAGKEKATVWTSDLSHEYVTINAEYRS